MKCKECYTKVNVVKNDSQSQALPFTVLCPKCKKWWDCSPLTAADIKGVPLNMVNVL